MEISKARLGKFRLLILGLGAVVTEFYLPALQLLESVSNALFIDTSTATLKTLAKKFPHIRCEQIDFREYFKNFSDRGCFDAAIVALPNHLHAQAVEMALLKGLHVLCEKPLAMNEQDCLRLGRLSEGTGKVLAVGMVRRLLPSACALKEALSSGLIGSLASIDIENGGPYDWLSDSGSFFQRENGGVLADMGVHYLDLIEELVGPLNPASYQDDSKGGVEANSEFRLISEKGIPVSLILSRTHHLRNTAIFKGEYGEIILEKDTFNSCLWRSYRMHNLITRLYPQKLFKGGDWPATLVSCFAEQILEFQELICTRASPRVNAHQAARTMRLIEWAYNHRQEKKVRNVGSESSIRPTLNPTRVVVTGGTGFIGGHLVSRLVDLGFFETIVPVRNYKTCAEVARFPIKMPRIDLLNYKQVKKTLQGAQFVFHLAYGRDGYDAARITVEGTKNVVNAAIECGVECVVILSSMYVFGHPDTDQLVNESWPYNPTGGEYGRSKAKMERWCLSRARNSRSTRIVVLNPSCAWGSGGKTYTQMPLQMASEGIFCWIEQGRGIANYTFIDNLIDAIILAASCKEAHGQRFIINDGFCSWRQFLSPLLQEFADSLPSFSKKDLIFKNRQQRTKMRDIISHLANDLELIDLINRLPLLGVSKRILLRCIPNLRSGLIETRGQEPIYPNSSSIKYPPEWLGDLFGPTRTKFSSEKAKKILGWSPRINLKKGQEVTLAWLRYINFI